MCVHISYIFMRSVYAVQIIILERTESSYPTKNGQKVTFIYSSHTIRTACQHFWAKFHTAVCVCPV